MAPGIERAGFGSRFLAWLIDAILLGFFGVALRFGHPIRPSGTTGFSLFLGAGSAVRLILGFAYYGYLEGGPAGQTLGKKIMNIRVVRVNTGGSLGWGPALIRNLCRYVSSIPCGLGYFWMLWDKDKMTWHDKLSSTLVVPTSVAPPPPDGFGRPPQG